jgi:hypothetical protein
LVSFFSSFDITALFYPKKKKKEKRAKRNNTEASYTPRKEGRTATRLTLYAQKKKLSICI